MPSRVIVLGTCVIDLISYSPRFPVPGETLIGTDFKRGFGGKGANQCVMASRLGVPSALLAKIGNDTFGREYLDDLKKNGINTDCVFVADGSITSTANICVASNGQNTIVYTPGAADLLSPKDIATAEESLFNDAVLLVCTFECQPPTLLEALKTAKRKGLQTLVNLAPVSEISLEEISSFTDYLCMNEVETSHYTKMQVDSVKSAEEAAVSLLKMNFASVIITLGENGVIFCTQKEPKPVLIHAQKVVTVDTTGAGDAFVGSLAHFLVNYPLLSLKEKIERSCEIASISVQAHGTQTSFPYKRDLREALFSN